jgi:hypothetical protein
LQIAAAAGDGVGRPIAMTRRRQGLSRSFLPFLAPVALAGCAPHGASSFILFGAYFPAWMVCAVIGMVAAIGARVAFVASGLSGLLPFQLFVCVSIGVIVGLLAWLLWFGQ